MMLSFVEYFLTRSCRLSSEGFSGRDIGRSCLKRKRKILYRRKVQKNGTCDAGTLCQEWLEFSAKIRGLTSFAQLSVKLEGLCL